MTDKIIILAGGISSRMKKQEEQIVNLDNRILKDAREKQKAMIGLGENYRPFLDYLLLNLIKAKIKDVVIVIGESDNSIKDYYQENKKNNNFSELNISYAVQQIPDGRTKPLGTADALYHGLIKASEWKGSTFIVCNSDNLYSVEAFRTLQSSEYPNAMIDYDRNSLLFENERIKRFAITKKNSRGFLVDIIEKPSDKFIQLIKEKDGYVGVSMNIFKFSYDKIFPFLEKTPLDPERNEKELPTSVKLMLKEYPDSMFAYPFNEHVPDLTFKKDIVDVQEYLKKEFISTTLNKIE
jgi:glucose-1-phosphate adenylyltransferase